MTIKQETVGKFIDGSDLIKTYSDAGFYIERDGVKYEEAIDLEKFGRVYTETDEPIPEPEPVSNTETEEEIIKKGNE